MLDWVLIAGEEPVTVATIQTDVGTVPEVTEVVTNPPASDVAEVGVNVTPPGVMLYNRLKVTGMPGMPLLLASTTLNFTIELFDSVGALAVEVPMIFGVADTNSILLATGAKTVIVVLELAPPATDAVIVSVPELQRLSL